MKKQNRKGFTIVELVIVIAVIAVLSAVLIPTFGGIIKAANISADKQMAASLTVALSADLDGIKDHDELYALIAETFDQETADNLAPKSAQYGYHFWYDVANNAIVLKTYDEIATTPGDGETGSLEQPSDAVAIPAVFANEPAPAAITFVGKEHRTFGNYYIIDMGGVIGDALKAMDTNTGISDALLKLNEIATKEYDDNKSIAEAILTLLGAVSKVTDFKITASGTGVASVAGNYYASYHIADLKLSADDFASDTGASAPQGIKWYLANEADNKYATIDIDTGAITLNKDNIIVDAVDFGITFKAVADAGVEDAEGNKLSKTVTVYIEYPTDVTFTLDGNDYDTDDNAIEIKLQDKNNPSFDFEIEDPSLKIGDPDVGCYADVKVTTDASNLFDIAEKNGKYTLTVKALDSYEGVSQTFTVTVGSAFTKTFTVTVTDLTAEPYQLNAPFATPAFLYRVGNGNAIPLSVFFNSEKPGDDTLYIYDIVKSSGTTNAPIGTTAGFTATVDGVSSANGEWSITKDGWAETKIQFTGTGTALIKIGEVSLAVEIVDGNNVLPIADGIPTISSPANGKNLVLLTDANIASGGKLDFINSILFGNNFTLDVSMGNYAGNDNGYTYNYVVRLENGTLNNVQIIGKNFESFYGMKDGADNVCNVFSVGNDVIANCYISGCAAPVRMKDSNLIIVGTTLSGGSFANLDIRGGSVVLENVTTINQKSVNGQPASEGALGLGVAVWYEQVASCKITVKGKLTQYNHVKKTDIEKYASFEGMSIIGSDDIANALFAKSNSAYIYTDSNDTEWINLGILSLIDNVNMSNINDANFNDSAAYDSNTVSFSALGQTKNGFVYTVKKENATLQNPGEYVSAGQYYVIPSDTINLGSNEDVVEEGNNDYCIMNGEKVIISFDEGESKTFSLEGFVTASKYGKPLTLTNVYLDGVAKDIDGNIIFDAEGTYTLKFVFNDIYNYSIDGTLYQVKFVKEVTVTVYEVAPDAKNAEFTFGSSNISSRVELINGEYWVMPDVTATSDSISSQTVNGTTVYCPIINCSASNGKTSQTSGTTWYMLFPVFKNVVTITDYENGGTGDAVTYNSTTTTLPPSLAAVNPGSTFQYSSAGKAPETPAVYSNVLYYTSPSCEGVSRDASNFYAEYTYKDNKGTTYHYYVNYKTPKITNTACVAEGTLITMADGSQKEIQYVTYDDQLLVWNHYTGAYDVVPAAIIFNHGYDYNTVIKLNFSDGTQVKAINLHQFLDVDLGKYVSIDATTVAQYVGHSFAKQDGNGYTTVTLESYEISEEYIEAYGIISALHYNILVEGMFSTDFMNKDYDLFNYFTIGEGLVYDADQMQADIEAYGLYTYEEFADYLTYEQFVGFNVQYFKIAVGRGLYTYEGIIDLIDEYLNA